MKNKDYREMIISVGDFFKVCADEIRTHSPTKFVDLVSQDHRVAHRMKLSMTMWNSRNGHQ